MEEAYKGVRGNHGGPFGAVIVREGVLIAKAHNRVLKTNDPTAHAEIAAIRSASRIVGSYDLSDCIIYATCEPCPMCLSAILWSRIGLLYYGATRYDAENAGFDDKLIYGIINIGEDESLLKKIQVKREACLGPFREWEAKADRIIY